jgi:hypothetical protein
MPAQHKRSTNEVRRCTIEQTLRGRHLEHHSSLPGHQSRRAGQAVLRLKTAWRDGTTHLVMTPFEFTQRLAAMVRRPRLAMYALCAERAARVTACGAQFRAVSVSSGSIPPIPRTNGPCCLPTFISAPRAQFVQMVDHVPPLMSRCPAQGQVEPVGACQ